VIPGIFYTPDDVADTLAQGAIALWLSMRTGESYGESLAALRRGPEQVRALLRGLTVLDPSCGAGALLAAALRAVPGGAIRILGADIDPSAIARCRERFGARAELRLADARASGPKADLVLTNPPYGRDSASGDIDRYVTFWRAALLRVKPGGVLAVLAPPSWLTGIRYAKARREVIEPSGVQKVIDLPRGSFRDAYVDTCIALCAPGRRRQRRGSSPSPPMQAPGRGAPALGELFVSRRGILAPAARERGTKLLLGPVTPFVWPTRASAFARVRPSDVVEGKAALRLDRGPRLLVRRIVGRASRLTCLVTEERALVKKDFYVLVPRDPSLSLLAYAALLHARWVTTWLAEAEAASTKEDFAQVTLARLRQLRVPRLERSSASAAWLERWARAAETLGRVLSKEGTRLVDGDPRWEPLRAKLDAFVEGLSTASRWQRRPRRRIAHA
jgi:SAM-dependent methyltransferase